MIFCTPVFPLGYFGICASDLNAVEGKTRVLATHGEAQTARSLLREIQAESGDVSGEIGGLGTGQGGNLASPGGSEGTHFVARVQTGVEAPRWS